MSKRAGFTSAPYEVPGPALYFDKSKRLDPQYTKTVLNQVQYNMHGYKCVGRYHTFERHPTKAQENRGRGKEKGWVAAAAHLAAAHFAVYLCSASPVSRWVAL